MEALQGVQLTGTNSSIGLNALIKHCSSSGMTMPRYVSIEFTEDQKSFHSSADLVAMAGWLHPIPFRTRP